MSAVIASLTQRFAQMRADAAERRSTDFRPLPTSIGESMAIGLGCDGYKRHYHA